MRMAVSGVALLVEGVEKLVCANDAGALFFWQLLRGMIRVSSGDRPSRRIARHWVSGRVRDSMN